MKPRTFLIAPDSFKGSLDAKLVSEAIEKGIRQAGFDVPHRIMKLPLSDGGEGFLERVIENNEGYYIECKNSIDPLGRNITAQYGILSDWTTAIIESAKVCGLDLVEPQKRDPKITTSYGLGLLVNDAIEKGCKKIIIGLGGSATNDGGAGFAQALGVKLLDSAGKEISFGGAALSNLAEINVNSINPKIKDIEFVAVCNPRSILCGKDGTSYKYGPQKGAKSTEELELLDLSLNRYGRILEGLIQKEFCYIPGSGAAGGIGASLLAFTQCKMISSMVFMDNVLGIEEKIKEADLIITGEGRLDKTSLGKVVAYVCSIAKKYDKMVIAIAGQATEDAQKVYPSGLNSFYCLGIRPRQLKTAIRYVEEDIIDGSKRMMEILNVGSRLGR